MKIPTYGPDDKDVTAPHEIHTLGLRPLLYLLSHPGATPQQMEETFITLNCIEITQNLAAEGFLRFGDWKTSSGEAPLYPTVDLKIYVLNNFELTGEEAKTIDGYEVVDLHDCFDVEDWEAIF